MRPSAIQYVVVVVLMVECTLQAAQKTGQVFAVRRELCVSFFPAGRGTELYRPEGEGRDFTRL